MIRLTIPSIDEEDIKAVTEALATGYLVQGPRVVAFENAVAEYVGAKHAVAVSNCTAALHLALLALGVGIGDLVVVTAYSWPSTANVIELCGAQPVFVDIDALTFNIDPDHLDATLRQLMAVSGTAERVKAILPVHTFGQLADMPAILEIANSYGLPVIEDAACALGASFRGRQAGTWGTLGCFSFHPRKAITTGEGGIVVTNDEILVRQVRAMRNHGQDPDASSIDFIMPGFNYRLTEFQAALGLTQMTKLDRVITARRNLAANYSSLLQDTSVQAPRVLPQSNPVYQSFVVLLPKEASSRRSDIITQLKSNGIETTIGTWHMPMTSYFRARYGHRNGDFPATDDVFARSLTLPLYEGLLLKQQSLVIEVLKKTLE